MRARLPFASTSRSRVTALVVLVALALLASAPVVRAQARDPAAAEALFRAGRDAAERSDWALACEKFGESHRLDPAAGTLLNLALCEESMGQLATAWQHYQQVVAELPDTDDRMPYARQHLNELTARVPRLTVRVASDAPAGMIVTRDGIEIGRASLGMALPVNPGPHVIQVTASGRQQRDYRVTVNESASEVVDVAPGDAIAQPERDRPATPAPPPPISPDAPPAPITRRTAGFVAIGVGLGGLVVGAITGALVFSKKGQVRDNCNPDGAGRLACNQAGQDASDAGQALATASTVSFVVGAAGLGLGVFLVATDRSTTGTASPRRVVTPAASLGIAGRF